MKENKKKKMVTAVAFFFFFLVFNLLSELRQKIKAILLFIEDVSI
jgi:hypothetical protein